MTPRSDPTKSALKARPHAPQQRGPATEPGLHALDLGGPVRDGRLFLPRKSAEPFPLMVLLHGAGADASSMLRLVGKRAAAHNCVLLAPDARSHTWDLLLGGLGPDVTFLDHALDFTFDRCEIDPRRIALVGFSDGASYALTLGLANGGLFTHVVAFSPGFLRQAAPVGLPEVFVSHGTADRVLPIDPCSRRIVPELQQQGYNVTYQEFDGPHTVPDPILQQAITWFLT